MAKDLSNILYVYLQKKMLQSVNNISAKKGNMSEEEKDQEIERLKADKRLVTRIHFAEARKLLNEYYNIPLRITTPVLYVMQDMKLLKIDGKFQNMYIEIINVQRGKLISKSNKLYSICL